MKDELGEVVGPAPIENDRCGEEFTFFSNCYNINSIRFKLFIYLFIYLFLAVLGLCCYKGFLFSWGKRGTTL